MAKLRVFVSSTCYDLGLLRSELRPFLAGMGYDPVMSEYSDILYDPHSHTHDSCLKEIPSCDIIVLIVGSRFGGTGIPSAHQHMDFTTLNKLSAKTDILQEPEKLSITQLEVLKAIESSIPVYTFVEEKVLHDHHVYEKNKEKQSIIDHIEFPSIQKKETAKYIFEFINFLRNRTVNNNICGFSQLEDIRNHLVSQMSQLFQKLLLDSRTNTRENQRFGDFSERIADLKAAVLASLATPDARDIAKGAVHYRRLISFASGFYSENLRDILLSEMNWEDFMKNLKIMETRYVENKDENRPYTQDIFFVKEDLTFYSFRLPPRSIDKYKIDWASFQKLGKDSREAIVDALLEDGEGLRIGPVRYMEQNIDEYIARKNKTIQPD